MIDVVPFKAEHVAIMRLQDAQASLADWITEDQAKALEPQQSYTALVDGRPIGSAGIIHQWEGRAIAWAFISDTGPAYFLPFHRAVKDFLDKSKVRRIEMNVNCDFAQAHRWAKLLGFKKEADCMASYNPDGSDCALYARIL